MCTFVCEFVVKQLVNDDGGETPAILIDVTTWTHISQTSALLKRNWIYRHHTPFHMRVPDLALRILFGANDYNRASIGLS